MSSTSIYLNLLRESKLRNLTDLERYFIKYHRQLAVITEVLVKESKYETTAVSAIIDIREFLQKGDI